MAGTSFNLIHRTTYLKADLFPCDSAFNRSALLRTVTIEVPGARETLRVSSLEDILLAKLQWYPLGGESSAVQQRDVRQLIELNREELDMAYLRQWGALLGVNDLLPARSRERWVVSSLTGGMIGSIDHGDGLSNCGL